MNTYARDVIQNAGLLSGILDVFSSADDDELRAYLNLLNNLTAQYSLQEYFPMSKDTYTVDTLLNPSQITIGKELINNAGLSDTYTTGTITGLNNDINTIADVPVFQDAHIVGDGVKLFAPGVATLNSGRVTDEFGNYFEIIAGTPAISGTITKGSTLTLTVANFNTNSGVYTDVDIFATQPYVFKSVAYVRDGVYSPLTIMDADQYDNSDKTTTATASVPRVAVIRKDFPITTVELYPPSTYSQFKLTAEQVLGPFEFNSEIRISAPYIAFLEQELAYRIAIMNGALEKVQLLKSLSAASLADIKRLNDRQTSTLDNSAYFGRTSYDINTDTWR